MMRAIFSAAAVLAAGAFAQTTTDCNPLSKTDCPVDPAIGMSNWTWYPTESKLNTKLWNNTGYLGVTTGGSDNVLDFTMAKTGQAPTIKTMGYFFYGTVTVVAKPAPGTGVISAITCLSDDLDEIDYEFKGSNDSFVFSNWYGKYDNTGPQGNMTQGAGADLKVSFNPTQDFHNYTLVWTQDTIQWLVDGSVLRTAKSSDPEAQGGKTFPQTPMRLFLGNWAGGDSSAQGTVDWAGGKTDWSKAPFVMSVKSVYVSDASGGTQYSYGDTSGSSSSIKIEKTGDSAFMQAATAKASSTDSSDSSDSSSSPDSASSSSSPSISDKVSSSYNSLSTGAKIGIIAGVLGGVALAVLGMCICCIKQRRTGRKERALADADFQKHETELFAYRQENQGRQRFTLPGFGNKQYQNI